LHLESSSAWVGWSWVDKKASQAASFFRVGNRRVVKMEKSLSHKKQRFLFGGLFEFLQLVLSKQPYGLGPLFFKTKKKDVKKWS